MKTEAFTDAPVRTPGRGTSRRAAAWLLSLTFAAAALPAPATLFAEVLDDFEDPVKSEQIWTKKSLFGTPEWEVANGVVTLAITPSGDHGFSYLWSTNRWTLRNGRTLEFRADLVSSSGDGAVGYIAFALGDEIRMYTLAIDQDTVGLFKRAEPLQAYYLVNGTPIKASNVKLVLSMTGDPSGVLLRFKVLNNDTGGGVIFEREFRDTAAEDPMQRGTDNPSASYLGLSGVFEMTVYHDNANAFEAEVGIGRLERAQVVFDNAEVLEYDSAWIAGPQTVACLPSWPENTAEEQIVVGASSLASNAVWTPWPEPIFKRFGELCMAVPTTETQQYFKLVPGTQFIDDFDPPKWPHATKSEWVPYFYGAADATRFAVTNAGNALRIRTVTPPVDGRIMVLPPGHGVVLGDFYASVDITDWPVQARSFGIGARSQWTGSPLTSNGYLGLVGHDPTQLRIFDGTVGVIGPAFTYDPATDYRLVFSGVGSDLSLRLVNLTTGTNVCQMSLRHTGFNRGVVALWGNATPGGSCDLTLDNFFVTGTKP